MTINLVSPSLVGTIADLKTFAGASLFSDHICTVGDGGNGVARNYRVVPGLAAVAPVDDILVVSPTTGAATARWLRTDPVVDLKLPWSFNTADGTVLLTVPTGMRLRPIAFACEVVTALTGVDTGSIGVSSTKSLNPGDIGLILATGGAGIRGTQGPDAGDPRRTMVAGDTIVHNLIAAGYTGGTGFWHVFCALMQL